MCKQLSWQIKDYRQSSPFQVRRTNLLELGGVLSSPSPGLTPSVGNFRTPTTTLNPYPGDIPLRVTRKKVRNSSPGSAGQVQQWRLISVEVVPIEGDSVLSQFQRLFNNEQELPLIHDIRDWTARRQQWVKHLRQRVSFAIERRITPEEEFLHLYAISAILSILCLPPTTLGILLPTEDPSQ
jgi:hypothetical protein